MINNRLIINIFILKTITIILDIGVTFVFPFGLVAMARACPDVFSGPDVRGRQ